MRRLPLNSPVLGVLFALGALQSGTSARPASAVELGALAIPSSVHTDHQQLRDDVARAMADIGAVGDAARNVERVLTPHLKHEEDVVLLPLGALRPVVDGEPIADTARVLALVARIERELPQLVQEHRAILDAAKRLEDTARRERKPEFVSLAGRVRVHVVLEDEVLYRASILVGRYLQLKEGVPTSAPRAAPAAPVRANGTVASPASGGALFNTYCASCHGRTARGDGPVALLLRVPPADLTQIARHNKGTFPKQQVYRIIDGRQTVKMHGASQMPVWGDAFATSTTVADEKAIAERIRALVDYLETIQERPGE